jgi:IclR family mhp operon transcriptional activator
MTAFNTVRSLKRGLEVLRALNRCDGAKAQALARIVGLPRPTVYRLLETLETLGYVARSPSDEAWHLTLQVKALSAGFHDETWVVRTAAPVLEALGREVLWPVDLVTLDRDAMAIRESTHGSSPFSIDRGMVGTRLRRLVVLSEGVDQHARRSDRGTIQGESARGSHPGR